VQLQHQVVGGSRDETLTHVHQPLHLEGDEQSGPQLNLGRRNRPGLHNAVVDDIRNEDIAGPSTGTTWGVMQPLPTWSGSRLPAGPPPQVLRHPDEGPPPAHPCHT